MLTRLLVPVSLAVSLGACGVPAPVPAPLSVTSPTLAIEIETDGQASRVVFSSRHAKGGQTPVAVLDGARLRLAGDAEATELRFVEWRPVASQGLLLECAPFRDHEVRVTLNLLAEGGARVEVVDRVGARSRLLELSLEFRLLGEGAVDETFLPNRERADLVTTDEVLSVPLAFLRRGARALTLETEIASLVRDRRIPRALELDVEPNARLRGGWVASQDGGGANGGASSGPPRLDPAAGVPVQGEQLVLTQRLYWSDAARARHTLAERVRDAFDRGPGVLLARSAAPAGRTFDVASTELAAALRAAWQEFEFAGVRVGGYADPAQPQLAAAFGVERQDLLAALGLALRAARTADPALAADAERLLELALLAPARAGLAPPRLARTSASALVFEAGHVPGGGLAARDDAWRGFWLWQIAAHFPAQTARIQAVCADTASFLAGNQLPNGSIPTRYDELHRAPMRDLLAETEAESGFLALFLTEHAAQTGDPRARAAARRSLERIASAIVPGGLWFDQHTRGLGDPIEAHGRLPLRSSLPIAVAALAALRAAEQGDAKMRTVGEDLLDQLAPFQWTWSPPWLEPTRLGWLATSNTERTTSPAVTGFAALAFAHGYLATGRKDFLQRGVLALRALLQQGAADPGTLGTALAVLELVRSLLGQGVVDLEEGFAQGVDALWLENLQLVENRVTFETFAEAAFAGPVQLRVRGLGHVAPAPGLTVNGVELGGITANESSLLLVPQRVARVDFAPPREIRIGSAWRARARIVAGAADPARAWLEVARGGSRVAQIRLVPDGAEGLVAEDPLADTGLAAGDPFTLRLVVKEGDRRSEHPWSGPRVVIAGTHDSIDPGFSDERELVAPGRSRALRCEDGPGCGRLARAGDAFGYQLPVAVEATSLELLVRVHGRVTIRAGPLELHADGNKPQELPRELRFALSDKRLWDHGTLAIRFEADADDQTGFVLHRLRWRTEGAAVAPRADLGTARKLSAAQRTLELLVAPVALGDVPLTESRAALQQAFFGGAGYFRTPAPNPQRTAGSVAELVAAFSGGSSRLEGHVLEAQELAILAATAGPDPERELARQALLRAGAGRPVPDAVILVHGPRWPFPAPRTPAAMRFARDELPGLDHAFAGVPVVWLPERAADGSLLASGDALAAFLVGRFDLPWLASPDWGSFGTLALTGTSGGHVPSSLLGIDLARIGWADLLDVELTVGSEPAMLANLLEGRVVWRLRGADLPGRGDLYLEARATSRADPGISGHGVLIYFDLPEPPLVQRLDGRRARPHRLRLTPRLAAFEVPFTPGGPDDLFQDVPVLDGGSSPLLANPKGEAPWRIVGLAAASESGATLRIESRVQDLLAQEAGFLAGGSQLGPTPSVREGAGYRLRPVASARVLEGVFPIQASSDPCRVFGTLLGRQGSLTIRLRGQGTEVLHTTIAAGDRLRFEAELPMGSTELRLHATADSADPAEAWLERLLVVPRTLALHRPPPDVAPPTPSQPLMDGVVHGATIALRPEGRGDTVRKIPLVLATQRSFLRVRGGLEQSAPAAATATLTLRLTDLDGALLAELVRDEPIARGEGLQPLFLGLLECPTVTHRRAGFLEIRVRSTTPHVLHLVDLALERG